MTRPLSDLTAAIRKNGLEQKIGGLFEAKGGKLYRACALGQAALNLGICSKKKAISYSLGYYTEDIYAKIAEEFPQRIHRDDDGVNDIPNTVIWLNDTMRLSLDEIADYLEANVIE